MRRAAPSALVLALTLTSAGCPQRDLPDAEIEDVAAMDRPRPDVQQSDVPRVDAFDASDASESAVDVGLDIAMKGEDAGMDAAFDGDGGEMDATLDGPVDVVPKFDSAVLDVFRPGACEIDASGARRCASDSDCDAASERCLPTGCGSERRCQPAGRPCTDASDCLAGLQTCTSGRCVATGADCGDTRACPLGYTCEGPAGARTCVNRRRPCVDGSDCPHNSLCHAEPGIAGFCVAIATRCASDGACLGGARCRDVDGDGLRECVPDGPCSTSSCPGSGGSTCEVLPLEFTTVCGERGLCNEARPCASGYECVDAWGTGVRECHGRTEPCRAHRECTGERSLCFGVPPRGASAPGCYGP